MPYCSIDLILYCYCLVLIKMLVGLGIIMTKSLLKSLTERPGQYRGQTLNQMRHGHGKYVYTNSFFNYEGDWYEGMCYS